MRRTSVLRFLCSVVAFLMVATTGIALIAHLSRQPGANATTVAADPRPTTTTAVPTTTSSTSTTSTSTTSTSTTVPPPTTTVPPPPTTVPPTTVPPPPTTVPPTTVPPTTTTVPPRTVSPAATTLRPGDEGPAVRDLQVRLRDLGYWLGGPDGGYGLLTAQAVTAFQKVEGLAPDGIAGPVTRAALAGAERPAPASTAGDLVEIDKARQIMFVVRDGEVAWTFNVSTGTEEPYRVDGRTELADTPPGRWTVSWAVDGVDVGALGALYRPRYFHPDGIAVHGYPIVPAYPVSHGCVRVTEAAMDWIWATGAMPLGSAVWVR